MVAFITTRARSTVSGILLVAFLATSGALPAFAEEIHRFDIATADPVAAIHDFATQAGVPILAAGDVLNGKRLNAVSGSHSTDEGLQLLLEGTGLSHRYVDDRAIALVAARSPAADSAEPSRSDTSAQPVSSEARKPSFWDRFRLAQVDAKSDSTLAGPGDPASEATRVELEEIVVTGTHIRGADVSVGSKVHVIDRDEIERGGYATAQQILQSLPQNFRGDASEAIEVTNADSANIASGAGINLRGLGSSATLVLLNGRRLVQNGGASASFVDISNLPVTAIERVEVLTDGASAIYGSDAIAGVVNFILRDSYEGAETRLRVGSVTDGGLQEYQFAQALGTNWDSGNVLFSYEYYDRDNLGYDERDFTASPDLRRFGGDNFASTISNPASIVAPLPAAVPSGQDGTSLEPGDLLLGQQNAGNDNVGKDILPTQQRHSVFLTAKQDLTDRVETFAEFRYARRENDNRQGGSNGSFVRVPDSNPYFVTPVPGATAVFVDYDFIDDFGPSVSRAKVDSGAGVLGATLDFGQTWRAELFGMYGSERVSRRQNTIHKGHLAEALGTDDPRTPFDPAVDGYFNIFADGSNTARNVLDYVGEGYIEFHARAKSWSANAKADGAVFALPAGAVKLAVGTEFRDEAYQRHSIDFDETIVPAVGGPFDADEQRDIFAAFAELLVPVFSDRNRLPGLERLQFSAAARFEDYSDFGNTTNPKLGVLWSPFESVLLRGSYGTSFKAPRLESMIPSTQFFVAQPIPNSAGGTSLALLLLGNNPSLKAEESTAWTTGIEFASTRIPALSVDLSYFNIAFEDRIASPGSPFAALLQPEIFAPILTRDPDDDLVQSYLDSPLYLPGFPVPPASQVTAIVDGRTSNLATTEVDGIDLNLAYALNTALGSFAFKLNGNYLLHFRESILETAPAFERIDTIGYQVDLRLRASLSWQKNAWSVTGFVNYADDYTDDFSNPARRIGAWTTLDLNARYAFAGASLSLNVENVFDRDPPFVNNPEGIGYDPQNADALGRFVSLSFVKEWGGR